MKKKRAVQLISGGEEKENFFSQKKTPSSVIMP